MKHHAGRHVAKAHVLDAGTSAKHAQLDVGEVIERNKAEQIVVDGRQRADSKPIYDRSKVEKNQSEIGKKTHEDRRSRDRQMNPLRVAQLRRRSTSSETARRKRV
jgi:hypothetical protein